MKKTIILIFSIFAVLFLVSCGSYKDVNKEDYKDIISKLEIDTEQLIDLEFVLDSTSSSKYVIGDSEYFINSDTKANIKGKILKDQGEARIKYESNAHSGTENIRGEKEIYDIKGYMDEEFIYAELLNFAQLEIPKEESKVKFSKGNFDEIVEVPEIPGGSVDDILEIFENEAILTFLENYSGFSFKQSGSSYKIALKLNKKILSSNLEAIKELQEALGLSGGFDVEDLEDIDLDLSISFSNNKLKTFNLTYKQNTDITDMKSKMDLTIKIKVVKGKLPKFPDFSDFILEQ